MELVVEDWREGLVLVGVDVAVGGVCGVLELDPREGPAPRSGDIALLAAVALATLAPLDPDGFLGLVPEVVGLAFPVEIGGELAFMTTEECCPKQTLSLCFGTVMSPFTDPPEVVSSLVSGNMGPVLVP